MTTRLHSTIRGPASTTDGRRGPSTTGSLDHQIRDERSALALLDRADVRAAVHRSASRWREGTPGLLPETYRQLERSIDEVALLVALQVVNGDARDPRVVEISAGPHTWGGLTVPGGRWGINNPDTLYFAVPVEEESTYVLRGRSPQFGPTDLNVSIQIPDVWKVLANLGRDQVTFDEDGGFTIAIGNDLGSRWPDGTSSPSRLPIPPGGSVVLIRQTLTEWARQLPYELTIERVSGPDHTARTSEDDRASRLIKRLAAVVEHNLHGLQQPVFGHPTNTIPQPDPPGSKPGYLTAQRSALGRFRLAGDEALVVSLTPGGAGYAAIAATTTWGVAADSDRHRNSVNTDQAGLDADGRLTVVVANRDPGVANWLDPGGFPEGILMLRWQLLGRHPDDPTAAQGPAVHVRPASIGELRDVMPAETEWIADPGQREAQLAARTRGYLRRFTRS